MWFNLLLLCILVICVITDLRERRIYNKLIFPSLLLAFCSHLLLGGWQKLSGSFLGFLVGLLLLLIPYLLGGMGAGDVKLLALIGALKGVAFVVHAALYMALSGFVIALGIMFLHRKGRQFFQYLLFYLYGLRYGIRLPLSKELSISYPYGVAIACGALMSLYLEGSVVLW